MSVAKSRNPKNSRSPPADKRFKRDATAPLIQLSRCSVILSDVVALNAVDFALCAGQRWLLVGANGAGKTVLLKLLAGDLWPTPTGVESRTYRFNGEVESEPYDCKQYIAYVGPERQDRYVRYEWNFTTDQIVTTGLFNEDIPRTAATPSQKRRIASLLRRFGLWSLRQRKFLTLSYGQRRRALVARAFASSPHVLLLDEVFNGLDDASATVLRRVLESRSAVAKTWIVSTHRMQDAPRNVTNIAQIRLGEVIAATTKSKAEILPIKSAIKLRSESTTSRRPKRSKAMPLLQLNGVDLYRDYRLVLRDLNWTIARNEHWVIVGRNGSGKSTLLKLLYGDLHPRLGGTVHREGVPFGTPIAEWKQRVGFVSPEVQAEYFLASNIEEVVISGRYASIGLNEPATSADRHAARRWLRFFGLQALAMRKPRAVSYGQMRLALLARAMINNPELLLLDEPFTGLDPAVRAQMIGLLEKLAKRGVQLLLAVHDRTELPSVVTHMLTIDKDKRTSISAL